MDSKKIFFVKIVFAFIVLSLVFVIPRFFTGKYFTPDSEYKHISLQIAGESFNGLVSDTEALREQGLSNRPGLKNGQVMFFAFEKPDNLGFWMKDMRFSIDMLWLDSNYRVVSFEKNVSPRTYPKVFFPEQLAQYVIELTAGTLDKLSLARGDTVSIIGGK